jgi:hypothetical protein
MSAIPAPAMATQDDITHKPKPSALRSIIAGSTAGAVEIAITYPAEFAKTRTQLNRRLPDSKRLPWPPFGRQWYAGCTTLIIGNSLKAGIRFVAFDAYKSLLEDAEGKVSGPRTVIAGFGAGITESLLAVTPFESIKTQLYDPRVPLRLHPSVLMSVGSTTGNRRTHECAASSTAQPSSHESRASEASLRGLCPLQRGRRPILPLDSRVILR